MTFEDWELVYKITIVVGVLACVPAGVAFYAATRRKADENGKRRGRPISSALLAVLVLTVPSLIPYVGFPEHAQHYRELNNEQDARADQNRSSQADRRCTDQWVLCNDEAAVCRAGVDPLDGAGRTACNRQKQACIQRRCFD